MLSEPPNEMPVVGDDAAHLSPENNRQTIQHVE
jgi:hypothetical protein